MPKDELSASQLERLGDRLRAGPLTLADLRQLRRFLETLEPFAERTFSRIRNLGAGGLRPAQITRRNVKTIRSIVAKLRRQTTKLVQVQDLIGCRIVVPDIIDQNQWINALERLFPGSALIDRRQAPRHGYRAIHLIVRDGIQRFEIQLRTVFQDEWANIVEKIDDRFGFALKYGRGDPAIARRLLHASASFADVEAFQQTFEARPINGLPGKMMVSTFVADYNKTLDDAYAGTPRRANPFAFSDIDRVTEEQAARSLRLVLWSSVELPAGLELLICAGGAAERIVVARESTVEASLETIAVPTFDDPRGGHVYEITQPSTANERLLHAESFADMVIDADVDLHNLEDLMK
jgi:ppGpp synthetase/RelA/SpoT-type nucleotidyltranferase